MLIVFIYLAVYIKEIYKKSEILQIRYEDL
jgi:hypothetical protein